MQETLAQLIRRTVREFEQQQAASVQTATNPQTVRRQSKRRQLGQLASVD